MEVDGQRGSDQVLMTSFELVAAMLEGQKSTP